MSSAKPRAPSRLVVHGARGRMGARIVSLAGDDPRFDVVAEISADSANTRAIECDAIIDFSAPAGAVRAGRLAVESGAALVVGTTGLSSENLRHLDDAARSVPVVIAPNMGIGVAVMKHVVAAAARLLGDGFEVALTETHHAGKRDAPSGTALDLAAVIKAAGRDLPPDRIRSIREGDEVGEHAVTYDGAAEILEIRHRAVSRDVFALGALRAGAWLIGQSPGQYRIEDALGLDAG